jgi:hypothetical protein
MGNNVKSMNGIKIKRENSERSFLSLDARLIALNSDYFPPTLFADSISLSGSGFRVDV